MIDIYMKAAVSKNMHPEDLGELHTFLITKINRTLSYIFDALYSVEDGRVDTYALESLFNRDYWDEAADMIIGNEADFTLSYSYEEGGAKTDELVGDAFLCRKILILKDKITDTNVHDLDIIEQLILYGTLDFWASECDTFVEYQQSYDSRNADREIIRYMLRTKYHMVPAKARVISDSIVFGEKMLLLGKTKQSLLFAECPMQYYMPCLLSHMAYLQKRFGRRYVNDLFTQVASIRFPGRHQLDEDDNDEYDYEEASYVFKVVS